MPSLRLWLRRFWRLLKEVFENFDKDECGLRAASLAYYGLFSIFPLLLFLFYLGGVIFSRDDIRAALDNFLAGFLPINLSNLDTIIDQTIDARGTIGITGAIGLLWSGSGVFGVLESALNAIWDCSPRPFWSRRLLAIVSVLALSILFMASVTLGPLTSVLLSEVVIFDNAVVVALADFAFGVLVAFLLFRTFTSRGVSPAAALIAAVVVELLMELAEFGVRFYLALAFRNAGYVYGSLAWIIALAFWVYFVGLIFFFGAEVGATLEKRFHDGL